MTQGTQFDRFWVRGWPACTEHETLTSPSAMTWCEKEQPSEDCEFEALQGVAQMKQGHVAVLPDDIVLKAFPINIPNEMRHRKRSRQVTASTYSARGLPLH